MEEVMNCQECGAALLPNAKFCSKCGSTARFEKGPAPQAATEGTASGAPEVTTVSYAPVAGTTFESVSNALRGFLRLDAAAVQDVRTNATLTVPAVVIAVAAIVASGLGGFLSYTIGYPDHGSLLSDGEFFLKTAVLGSLLGAVLWLVGTGVTIVVMRSTLKLDVRPEEVLRVAGFAATPLAIGFFIFIPGIDFGIGLLSAALLMTFTTLAVHKAFDLPAERALVAVAPGFAVWALVLPLLVTSDNPLAPGVFVFDWGQDFLSDILG
jgi:hypothetical protein